MSRWWLDEPISTAEQDELARHAFAERVSRVLAEISTDPASTVLGLIGPWGSGKSSTARLICELLGDDRWHVAWVNPWALSSPDGVVSEVLSTIENQFADEHIKAALRHYGKLATPLLKLVPLVGDAAKAVADVGLSLTEQGESLTAQSRKIDNLLSTRNERVLIIVDDVDRLQPDELLALFKAIRVLGRLSNIHYLLCFDEQTLLDVLSGTEIANASRLRALAFLDKVVSVRLDQPPTLPGDAGRLLNEGLAALFRELTVTLNLEDEQRLNEEKDFLLRIGLHEPRTVRRFLTQLRIYLPLVGPEEVDIVDFIVISWIRGALPDLYLRLSRDRFWLAGVGSAEGVRPEWTQDSSLADLQLELDSARYVWAALGRIFPTLSGAEISTASLSPHLTGRRVCNPDYVDSYFELRRERAGITDTGLSLAVQEWLDGEPGISVDVVTEVIVGTFAGSPGVARRLNGRTAAITGDACATLIEGALGLLERCPETPAKYLTRQELISWLTELISRSSAPPPPDLVELVAGRNGLLWSLIVAVRRLLPADGRGRSRSGVVLPHLAWLQELAQATVEPAWNLFVANVAAGDNAPREAAHGLLLWVESHLGPETVNARLQDLLDGAELPLGALAARFVETGTDLSTYSEVFIGFEPDPFIARLGVERIRASLSGLQTSDVGQLADEDVTWESHHRRAVVGLNRALEAFGNAPLPELPAADPDDLNRLRNYRPVPWQSSVVPPRWNVRVALGLWLQPSAQPLPLTSSERDAVYTSISDTVAPAVAARIFYPEAADEKWELTTSRPEWMTATYAFVDSLQDQESNAPTHLEQRLETAPSEGKEAASSDSQMSEVATLQLFDPRWQSALMFSAQTSSTTASIGEGTWYTFGYLVGFWPRTDSRSCTLAQLHQLVQQMLTDAMSAVRRLADVFCGAEPSDFKASMMAILESSDRLTDLIDLPDLRQVGNALHAEYLANGSLSDRLTASVLAARVIQDWFDGADYRGAEDQLRMLGNLGSY